MSREPYALIFAPKVLEHLAAIEKKYHRLIKQSIHEQLSHGPTMRTRQRKPLEELPGSLDSTWELRFGPDSRFRAFYKPLPIQKSVWILAIGVKTDNRLFIGGKEFKS